MRASKSETTKGEVHLCDWAKLGKEFQIRVVGKPDWVGVGKTFEAAEEELLEKVIEATDDMQPCFEYTPEPPKNAIKARFARSGILGLSGANDPMDFVGTPEQLFSKGVCRVCKHGIGNRTELPLKVSWRLPDNSDGGFVRIRIGGPFVSFSMQVFSEAFVAVLTAEERKRFKWIPVEAAQKSKNVFFEPLSFPLADKVMPKGLSDQKDSLQEDGFYCKECGRKQLTGIPQGSGGLYTFISEADLPRSLPSCFQVGQCSRLEFCMTKNRWEQLVGKSGTRRLLSRQIGILKRSWVSPNPKLQLLDAQSAGQ